MATNSEEIRRRRQSYPHNSYFHRGLKKRMIPSAFQEYSRFSDSSSGGQPNGGSNGNDGVPTANEFGSQNSANCNGLKLHFNNMHKLFG